MDISENGKDFYGYDNTVNDYLSSNLDEAYLISRTLRQHNFRSSSETFTSLKSDPNGDLIKLPFMGRHYFANFKRNATYAKDETDSLLNNNRFFEQTTLPIRALGININTNVGQPECSGEYLLRAVNVELDDTALGLFNSTKTKRNYYLQITETYKVGMESAQLYSELKHSRYYDENLTIGVNSWNPRMKCAVTKQGNHYELYIYKYKDVNWLYNYLSVVLQDILNQQTVALFESPEENTEYGVLAHDVFQALYDRNFANYAKTLMDVAERLENKLESILSIARITETLQNLRHRKRDRLNNFINDLTGLISRKEDELALKYNQLEEKRLQLLGLDSQDDESQTRSLELTLKNNRDKLPYVYYDTEIDQLDIEVITPCTSFDADVFERFFHNTYRHKTRYDDALAKIFIDQEYTLYLKEHVYFNIQDATVHAQESFHSYHSKLETYGMPNPHTSIYDCFGNNKSIMQRLISQGELGQALLQLIVSIGDLNFTDGTVANAWNKAIEEDDYDYTHTTCIQDAEGNWYSLRTLQLELEGALEKTPEPVEIVDTLAEEAESPFNEDVDRLQNRQETDTGTPLETTAVPDFADALLDRMREAHTGLRDPLGQVVRVAPIPTNE